jgi:hypothetical protein
MIPQNVCQCLCLITIPRRSFHRTCGASPPIKGCIDSLTVYIYKAETCTNILRYTTCMSSYPGDRKCTKIDCQKSTKNQYAVLPVISVRVLASHFSSVIGNFRSSGWLDLHVIYQAETCTNILRYNTCMSSSPGDRKCTKISFYIWSPPLARKMRKTNMRYYPEYPSGSWHPILAP